MSNEVDLSLINLLSLQLTEIDMLISMYPSKEELKLDDEYVIEAISAFVNGSSDVLPPRLDFTLFLNIAEEKLEISCSFPHDYPVMEPEVYARSESLTRCNQHKLNEDMTNFLAEQPRGELCIGSLIQWLQDNAAKYFTNKPRQILMASSEDSEEDESFSRLWIYSHHIYNKYKRRSILELGHQLQLTGFCLPGKPGIICVEGHARDCSAFWHRIKHMNWKKIILKKKESIELIQDIASLQRFDGFEEVSFQPRKGPSREYHMDMGEFFQFLEEHHCGYIFRDYFGIDGHLPCHS